MDERGSRVAVRLQDGTPLLLEKPLGEGRVMLFASGFDNLTNDLPLHPVFVAFVGTDCPLPVRQRGSQPGRTWWTMSIALRTAKEQAVGVEVIDPSRRTTAVLAGGGIAQSY